MSSSVLVLTVGKGRPWECLREDASRTDSIAKSDDESICYSKQDSNDSILSNVSDAKSFRLSKGFSGLASRADSMDGMNMPRSKLNITVGNGPPRSIVNLGSLNKGVNEYHTQGSCQSVSSVKNSGEAYDMLNLMPSYDFTKHLDSSKVLGTPQPSRSNSKSDFKRNDSGRIVHVDNAVPGDAKNSSIEKLPSVDQVIKNETSVISILKANVSHLATVDPTAANTLQREVSKGGEAGFKKSVLDRIRTRIKLIGLLKENAELNATFKNGSFGYGMEPLRSCGTDNTNDWEHSGSNNDISTAEIQRDHKSTVVASKPAYDGETISANYNRKLSYIQKRYGDIESALKEVQENSPKAANKITFRLPGIRNSTIPQLWLEPKSCKTDYALQYPRLYSLYTQSKNGITNTG